MGSFRNQIVTENHRYNPWKKYRTNTHNRNVPLLPLARVLQSFQKAIQKPRIEPKKALVTILTQSRKGSWLRKVVQSHDGTQKSPARTLIIQDETPKALLGL